MVGKSANNSSAWMTSAGRGLPAVRADSALSIAERLPKRNRGGYPKDSRQQEEEGKR
jgi:hypothetical protein